MPPAFPRCLWYSIYRQVPSDSKEPVREWKSFYFNEAERKNIAEVAPFLQKDKRIKDLPKPDTVDDSLARQVFKEAGYTPVSD